MCFELGKGASLDVVCDELYDCAWNVGLYHLSD